MTKQQIKQILFLNETAEFDIPNESEVLQFLQFILEKRYNKKQYFINFIALNSEDIIQVNKKYLNHDYSTDVISFDYSLEYGFLSGDIFVCPEVVQQNSDHYETSYFDEMLRVLIHGLLHFLGFDDKKDIERLSMTEEEEVCIELFRTQYYL